MSGQFPLSLQQEFLRLIDHGDESGPFGPWYHIVGGWRLRGYLDLITLQTALDDLVERHESLRTTLVLGDDEAYNRIHPPAAVPLEIRDLSLVDLGQRDRVADALVNEIESQPYEMNQVPALRVVLGRFAKDDAVLVFVAHHVAVDGWSAQIIVRDLAGLYAARRGGGKPDLPITGQYQQFVRWQEAELDGSAVQASRAFWQRTLRGARITPVPTDRPRREEPSATSYYRFLLGDEYRTGTLELAANTRSTPFMVLFAAYIMLLHQRTGATDIVAPTFTPGRIPAWSQDTIGSFYNFVPIRVDLEGCAGFAELVKRTRSACLAAYAHELPFGEIVAEAPELLQEIETDNAACILLQVVQSPFIKFDEPVGDIRWTAMRRRLVSQPAGSAIPDGALWNLELNAPGIVGSIGYIEALFDSKTMGVLVEDFCEVLRSVFADPDRPLGRS